MDKKFFRNYLQILGGSFCLLATCLGYTSGFMLVGIQKIIEYFQYIGITGTLASYTLIPLCITLIVLGIVNKENMSNLNKAVCIVTIIVGFMGTHFYFIIPSVIIIYVLYLNNKIEELQCNEDTDKIEDTIQLKTPVKDTTQNTKIEMAKELLEKNFSKTFISEVTGLTLKEINLIEELNKRD